MISLIVKEFVDTLSQFDDYNISIFDKFGALLFFTKDYIDVDRNFFDILNYDNKQIAKGISKGHHVTVGKIEFNEVDEGYIMIEGSTNNEEAIINLVKKAIELRLKFQEAQDIENKFLSVSAKLIKKLVNYRKENDTKIKQLFNQGKFDFNETRVLIILKPDNDSDIEYLENTSFYYDSRQDIVAAYEDLIVILKKCKYDIVNNYNEYINYTNEYIEFIKDNTVFEGEFYVSYPQFEYVNYKESYNQVKWLIANKNILGKINNNIYYFKNYLDMYLFSKASHNLYGDMFDRIIKNTKNFDLDEFLTIWPIIIKNNYNIAKSSQDLYLHKNTLIYKIEKLKKLFNVDPINVETDRSFLKYLYYYILDKN